MNQEGEKIKLYDSPLENNNDIKRSYFSFVPPFPPKYLPKFEGDTQFYGTIYHVDEKNVYFAIDILDNFAMIYVDTNMNKQLSNEEGQILFKELTIEINPFKDSKVKIRLNLTEFFDSHYLSPFIDYQILNKKLADIKLGDINYRFILIDLQNNGFTDIAKDKILLESDMQLRTLDIDSNFGSYLRSHEKTYEFIISNDLDYIEIKEKHN